MRQVVVVIACLWSSVVCSHEMLPSHPVLRPSYVAGVLQTQMHLFNKRRDVEYYEIGVFDEDFEPVSFVTAYRVIRLQYLEQLKFDVYVLADDADRAEYICSRSKLRGNSANGAMVASRICSRFSEVSR